MVHESCLTWVCLFKLAGRQDGHGRAPRSTLKSITERIFLLCYETGVSTNENVDGKQVERHALKKGPV